MSIGDNIKRLRKLNNLTMRELAEKADIPSSYLSNLENGKIGNPSLEVLDKLCCSLSITADELMNGNTKVKFVDLKQRFLDCDCDMSEFSNSEQEILSRYIKLIDRKGKVVKHFKGNMYLVLDVALDVEAGDLCVVYKALYGDMGLFTRPVIDFLSRIEYGNLIQKYRFEFIDLKE